MLACGEVVDEAAGGVDVGAAACGDAWRDLVLPVGLCSADDVPAGVAGEHAAHFGVSNIGDDLGSVAVQPGDVLIACRKRTGGDEQGTQIGHREKLRQRIESHMAQLESSGRGLAQPPLYRVSVHARNYITNTI